MIIFSFSYLAHFSLKKRLRKDVERLTTMGTFGGGPAGMTTEEGAEANPGGGRLVGGITAIAGAAATALGALGTDAGVGWTMAVGATEGGMPPTGALAA